MNSDRIYSVHVPAIRPISRHSSSAVANVTFGGTVPAPATPLLVLAGLAAMGVVRRSRPRAVSVA